MLKNEVIEVLKEGKPIEKHNCCWVDQLNYDTPERIIDRKRICRLCGRTEHITQTIEKFDFDDLYNKFHGQGE